MINETKMLSLQAAVNLLLVTTYLTLQKYFCFTCFASAVRFKGAIAFYLKTIIIQ